MSTDSRETEERKLSGTRNDYENIEDKGETVGIFQRNNELLQILIMGGEREGNKLDELVILDRKTSAWKALSLKLPFENSDGGSVALNGDIYVFGGWGLKDKLYKLDSRRMEWIEMAKMNEERMLISNSSLALDGCIWVFGGWNFNNKALKTMEKYYPKKNKWIQMPLVYTPK